MKPAWVIVVAVLGVPATLVYIAVIPTVGISAVAALLESPSADGAWFVVELLCAAWALVAYWRLAVATAHSRSVRWSLFHYVALAAGAIAAPFFILVTNISVFSIAAVLCMVGATLALVIAQRRISEADYAA